MAQIKEEELTRIMYKGYHIALGSCFDNKSLYAKGFLDGMNFQKDGTIPKDKFDKILEELEKDKKQEKSFYKN